MGRNTPLATPRQDHKINVRPEAAREVQEAFDWYEEKSEGLGLEFLRRYDEEIEEAKKLYGALQKKGRAKKQRAACGCSGTVKGRTIELQGDQPAKVRMALEAEGFQVAGVR